MADNSRTASVTSEELKIVSQVEVLHKELKDRSRSPVRGRSKPPIQRSRVPASLTSFDYTEQLLAASVFRRSLLVSSLCHIPTCWRCLTLPCVAALPPRTSFSPSLLPSFPQILNLGVDALSRSHLHLQPTMPTLRILLSLRVLPSLPPLVCLCAGRPSKARTLSLLVARRT